MFFLLYFSCTSTMYFCNINFLSPSLFSVHVIRYQLGSVLSQKQYLPLISHFRLFHTHFAVHRYEDTHWSIQGTIREFLLAGFPTLTLIPDLLANKLVILLSFCSYFLGMSLPIFFNLSMPSCLIFFLKIAYNFH